MCSVGLGFGRGVVSSPHPGLALLVAQGREDQWPNHVLVFKAFVHK